MYAHTTYHTHNHALNSAPPYRYTDDIPSIDGELYAGLVMSARPHAKITVDYSEAVKMKGVRAYVGAQDVPGSNCHGNFF